jgi:hypothetical protein
MNVFRKKPSSLPHSIRQSIALRKIRFFQVDARLKPAHDGVRAS